MTTYAASRSRPRTRSWFPARLLQQHVQFTVAVWLSASLFVFVVTFAVSLFRDIEISGWHQAAGIVQWYAAIVAGVHFGWTLLPLHVTHGQTRREFTTQTAVFIVIFAAVLSLMVAATYIVEAAIYELAGWPQEFDDRDALYDSGLQVHLIVLQHWLTITLWTIGGFFVAASWYRHDVLGVIALIISIGIAGVSLSSFSADGGPLGYTYEWITNGRSMNAPVAVVSHLVLIALVSALSWLVVRDLPIRSKSA